jgi:hypothetical protein
MLENGADKVLYAIEYNMFCYHDAFSGVKHSSEYTHTAVL